MYGVLRTPTPRLVTSGTRLIPGQWYECLLLPSCHASACEAAPGSWCCHPPAHLKCTPDLCSQTDTPLETAGSLFNPGECMLPSSILGCLYRPWRLGDSGNSTQMQAATVVQVV